MAMASASFVVFGLRFLGCVQLLLKASSERIFVVVLECVALLLGKGN